MQGKIETVTMMQAHEYMKPFLKLLKTMVRRRALGPRVPRARTLRSLVLFGFLACGSRCRTMSWSTWR